MIQKNGNTHSGHICIVVVPKISDTFLSKNSFQVCWGQTKTLKMLKTISQKLSYQRIHVTGIYLQLVYGECIDRFNDTYN